MAAAEVEDIEKGSGDEKFTPRKVGKKRNRARGTSLLKSSSKRSRRKRG